MGILHCNLSTCMKMFKKMCKVFQEATDGSDFFIRYYLHVNFSGLKRNKLQNVNGEILDS